MIRVIAKRYAKALAELSEEKKIVEKTRADLRAFADAVAAHSDLQKLFASPVFTPEDKKAVIGELAGRMKLQPETRRFIEFLAETGRRSTSSCWPSARIAPWRNWPRRPTWGRPG